MAQLTNSMKRDGFNDGFNVHPGGTLTAAPGHNETRPYDK